MKIKGSIGGEAVDGGAVFGGGGVNRGAVSGGGERSTEGQYWGEVVNGGRYLGATVVGGDDSWKFISGLRKAVSFSETVYNK